MAAGDAKTIPLKNQAFRITFPILDNTGSLVTGAAGLDSEVSIDGGTFSDCTNEATEIATSSGIYYLDLTAAEMNGDSIAVIVKTTTTDAKTTPIIMYPQTDGLDMAVNVTHWNGDAVATPAAAGYPAVTIKPGTGTGEVSLSSGAVTVGTNNDKSNYGLSATAIQAIWDALTSALVGVGSIGKLLVDNINAAISSRSSHAAADVWSAGTRTLTANTNLNDPTAAVIADAVWDEARAGHVGAGSFGEGVSSVQGGVTGNVDGSVSSVSSGVTVSDKTGFSLSTAGIKAIWDQLVSALTAIGSIGKLVVDNLDATVSSASAPSAGAVADAVWDELLSEHAGVGSAGAGLSAAGGAGDPWSTALPGAYGAGTAGNLIGSLPGSVWDELRSAHVAPGTFGAGVRPLNGILAEQAESTYLLPVSIVLGEAKAGLTLAAQLIDTAGVDVGSEITTGFSEQGEGHYIWSYEFEPYFYGAVLFYEDGVPGTILAMTTIDPTNNVDLMSARPSALSVPAAQLEAVLAGTDLLITRGVTFSQQFTGMGSLVGRTKLWFTLKDDDRPDIRALIQVEETDGLLYLQRESAATAGWGSITVDDADAGDVTISWTADAAALLVPRSGLSYDFKVKIGSTVSLLTQGNARIEWTVTRAIT